MLTVEGLDQTYHEIAERRYASAGGHEAIRTGLASDEDGLVAHYPNLWTVE